MGNVKNDLRTFICRIAPRTHRRNKPRGTLIDPTTSIESVDPERDYQDYYESTIAQGTVPSPMMLEFGQPPIADGELQIRVGDLAVLLIGSDDPDGGTNVRGVVGLARVNDIHIAGKGNNSRCTVKLDVVVKLQQAFDKTAMNQSPFFGESGLRQFPVFGLTRRTPGT